MTYRLLDLFSGIGGFSLGLERTGGFKTVGFCEIDPYCQRVLNKNWPGVPVYADIRNLTAPRLAADGITVDAICGGFPCQDISRSGKKEGIQGARSGLWKEYARVICELRPRLVFVENVSDLLKRGMDVVLGDLAALGYDAGWHCIPAAAVGAPHVRDRLWIVAYPDGNGSVLDFIPGFIARGPEWAANDAAFCRSYPAGTAGIQERYWPAEPDVGRVADGVPARAYRLAGLGNAVVPQIPELIGRAVLAAEEAL